ncbi:hypothetical protein ABH962_002615 [Bacillus sp. RC54]
MHHHKNCKKFGVALPLPLIGATGPTGNVQLEGMKVRSVLRELLDLEEQLVHKAPKVSREYKVREGQQELKEYKVPLVILETKELQVRLVYKVLKD